MGPNTSVQHVVPKPHTCLPLSLSLLRPSPSLLVSQVHHPAAARDVVLNPKSFPWSLLSPLSAFTVLEKTDHILEGDLPPFPVAGPSLHYSCFALQLRPGIWIFLQPGGLCTPLRVGYSDHVSVCTLSPPGRVAVNPNS